MPELPTFSLNGHSNDKTTWGTDISRGTSAYADFQEREFASEPLGYTATRHQREVGTGYFDEVAKLVGGGRSSTTALTGSTEEAQFKPAARCRSKP